MARIPPHAAFDFYVSLGSARSYQAVAEEFGTSKRAILKLATREKWPERLAKIEDEARARMDEKAVETIEAMNERHLKTVQAMQAKALQALRSMPLSSGMEAIRALDMAIARERLIRG